MENALSINPLNWKRSDAYAPASENLGSRIPIKNEKGIVTGFQVDRPGILDARLDLERGVVVCTTVPDQYLVMSKPELRNPFGPASLHLLDYPGYWENIRENVKARINAYFGRKR